MEKMIRTAGRLVRLVMVAVALIANAIPILIDCARFYINRWRIP